MTPQFTEESNCLAKMTKDTAIQLHATIVWFPEDTCITFQVAKIHAGMIKVHQIYFIESIPYKDVNTEKIRKSNYKFRNTNKIENKLIRFQIYPETELACSTSKNAIFRSSCRKRTRCYRKINHKSPCNILLNQRRNFIHPSTPPKNTGNTGGKIKPQDKDRTRLQELSLMNNSYFGAIHYDIHLDMKLDYTITRIFQEMSLSELETLHHLC